MLKLNCLGILSPLTEFGAVARTYPVACSGVRQRNFDFIRFSCKAFAFKLVNPIFLFKKTLTSIEGYIFFIITYMQIRRMMKNCILKISRFRGVLKLSYIVFEYALRN